MSCCKPKCCMTNEEFFSEENYGKVFESKHNSKYFYIPVKGCQSYIGVDKKCGTIITLQGPVTDCLMTPANVCFTLNFGNQIVFENCEEECETTCEPKKCCDK